MSLTSSSAYEAISADYLTTVGVELDQGVPIISENPRTNTFGQQFASHYNAYASEGVVPGASNNGGDPLILEAVFSSESLNNSAVLDVFATALANYWSGVAIDPGAPAHGGTSVDEVTNDAASKVSEFKAAIQSILTTNDTQPYFKNLIDAVESVVKNDVTWTVTELMPPNNTPASFPENIS